jgi:Spy/CpxP family protein refolding chaperone
MSESGRPLRRARALSAALLAVVFVAGGLVGAAADRALGSHGGDRHSGRRHGMEAEILDRLNLDAGQKAEVEKILERRRAEAGVAWSEVKPRLSKVVAGTRDDLSRVLTPDQLAEYDRLMAERWRRMEGRFESGTSTGKPTGKPRGGP